VPSTRTPRPNVYGVVTGLSLLLAHGVLLVGGTGYVSEAALFLAVAVLATGPALRHARGENREESVRKTTATSPPNARRNGRNRRKKEAGKAGDFS
jgi:hypothetical protein